MFGHLILSPGGRLRSGWWIAFFFCVMAGLLVPLLVVQRRAGDDVTIVQQAAIVAAASLICQALRRRPIAELIGALDRRWLADLVRGGLAGAALMLVPALVLRALGDVHWEVGSLDAAALARAAGFLAVAALVEELLFRGFFFQRLVDGLGPWPAQLIVAGFFLLTHVDAIAMAGPQRMLACANIFLASIMFGTAFLRTRRLAWPIGMHLAANATQGILLGFGVSGSAQPRLFVPVADPGQAWMTGGPFGLEASIPGLVCVVAAVVLLHRWRSGRRAPTPTHRRRE